jgi:tetratricopeptide (TPR) repeat protein
MGLAKENPGDPLVLWMLGVECRSCKLDEEGVKYYAQLCNLWNPGPVLVHQTYANLLDDLGRSDEALPHRKLAVKLEPAAWAYDGLGNTLTALKRWNEADEAYLNSTTRDPNDVQYWTNWACSMQQRGDEAGAARMQTEAGHAKKRQDDADRERAKKEAAAAPAK